MLSSICDAAWRVVVLLGLALAPYAAPVDVAPSSSTAMAVSHLVAFLVVVGALGFLVKRSIDDAKLLAVAVTATLVAACGASVVFDEDRGPLARGAGLVAAFAWVSIALFLASPAQHYFVGGKRAGKATRTGAALAALGVGALSFLFARNRLGSTEQLWAQAFAADRGNEPAALAVARALRASGKPRDAYDAERACVAARPSDCRCEEAADADGSISASTKRLDVPSMRHVHVRELRDAWVSGPRRSSEPTPSTKVCTKRRSPSRPIRASPTRSMRAPGARPPIRSATRHRGRRARRAGCSGSRRGPPAASDCPGAPVPRDRRRRCPGPSPRRRTDRAPSRDTAPAATPRAPSSAPQTGTPPRTVHDASSSTVRTECCGALSTRVAFAVSHECLSSARRLASACSAASRGATFSGSTRPSGGTAVRIAARSCSSVVSLASAASLIAAGRGRALSGVSERGDSVEAAFGGMYAAGASVDGRQGSAPRSSARCDSGAPALDACIAWPVAVDASS